MSSQAPSAISSEEPSKKASEALLEMPPETLSKSSLETSQKTRKETPISVQAKAVESLYEKEQDSQSTKTNEALQALNNKTNPARAKTKTRSKALMTLTGSALALPGVFGAAPGLADTPPAASVLSYRVSSYQEDDLAQDALLIGSPERYDIDIHQLRFSAPVGERTSMALESSYESMSGASPWYTLESVNGDTQVAMSGATIYEKRRDITASVRRYYDTANLGVSLTVSDENDYRSNSIAVDGSYTLANNSTTISAGIAHSDDEITPTDALLFNRVEREQRNNTSAFLSFTQIINQFSIVQTGMSSARAGGFLSDPYKLADRRPQERNQFTWTTSWRRYFRDQRAAFHANYRLYDDDFGVRSHTLDFAVHKAVSRRLTLVPSLRMYRQTAADFFTPATDFAFVEDLNSSDYRLSDYDALSAGLKVNLQLGDYTLVFSGERYTTSGSQSPAIVEFTRLSAGVDFSF